MRFFKLTGVLRHSNDIVESRWYPMDIEWDDINQCIVYGNTTQEKYIKLMNDICYNVKSKYLDNISRAEVDEINRKDGYK